MNPEILTLLLAAHAVVTLFMTGLIWFVQVVHYPLFARVGTADFACYGQHHTRRTAWVVGGPMLLEFGLACVLAWAMDGFLTWCGLGLLVIIWLSTAIWQIPMHRRLELGFDQLSHRRLVWSNWARTVAWSLRGVLATVMLAGN